MVNDLIHALGQAEAGSQELDSMIAEYFGEAPGEGWTKGNIIQTPKPYTTSLDAAVTLAQRVLLGWHWGITQGDDGQDAMEFQGNVWPGIQPYPADMEQYGYHKLPAIALVLAIVRAKEAERS